MGTVITKELRLGYDFKLLYPGGGSALAVGDQVQSPIMDGDGVEHRFEGLGVVVAVETTWKAKAAPLETVYVAVVPRIR